MKLASVTIQEGMRAFQSGLTFCDNPYTKPVKGDLYEAQGVPPNNWLAKIDLDWHSLWGIGWNIGEKIEMLKIRK